MKTWFKDFEKYLSYCTEDDLYYRKKAFALKNKHLPSSIFKYRNFYINEKNIIYSLENLENQTVHLSNPNDFNDPYDSSFIINEEHTIMDMGEEITINHFIQILEAVKNFTNSGGKETIKKMEEKVGNLDEHIEKYKGYLEIINLVDEHEENLVNTTKNIIKICSFSERNDSLLMWSHYSGQHTGFCIEYNIELLSEFDKLRLELYPINYSDKLYKAPINNLFNHILSATYKSLEWDYEDEWRLIVIDEKNSEYLMPKPKAIYLGSKISDENKDKILKIVEHQNIPIYQMVLDRKRFKIYPVREC